MDVALRIFKGATAIVTGAASGLGKAMSIELSKRGCTVILVDKQASSAQDIAAEICLNGGRAWAYGIDVSDYPAVYKMVIEVVNKTGRLDYMFNNAGIGIGGPAAHYSIEDWDYTIDVNLRGVTNGIQAVYPLMISQGFGHIVNTASITGLIPASDFIAYTTTKFAIIGLSRALRVEAKKLGIRVSVLCPGAVKTPMLDNYKLSKEITKKMTAKNWEKFLLISPEKFSRDAIDMVAKNKAIIIIPRGWLILYWLNKLGLAL